VLQVAAAAPLLAGPAAAQPAKPPNIVFILADDLGYADVGCYGAPDIATPAIDRLAAEGVRFTQAYANSAVCSATRCALITGRYQYRLRVGLEEPLDRAVYTGLPPAHPTLPSILKKAGYRTALVGKWHLGDPPRYGPLKSGYDQFWGVLGAGVDYFSHDRSGAPDLYSGTQQVAEAGYLTDLIGDHALGLMSGYALEPKPFFLSLHFTAPHWPWEGPNDQAESARLKGRSLIDFDGGDRAVFARMVERMDYQIGRVLKLLDAMGAADNTIVVFTSDNGGERFSDTWPFTGKKTELLEGGLRIPCVVRWPARLPKNAVSEQVNISMDWFPTLLSAAGTAPDRAYPPDGIDLLPHLGGGATVQRQLFWRYKANFQRAVREGDWKALKIQDNSFLFNVVKDPLERANLKDREPEVFQRLIKDWNFWNRSMLPEIRESFTEGFSGAELADHYGAAGPKVGVDEADWK
jgi:arylsulfatase A-like enzyme